MSFEPSRQIDLGRQERLAPERWLCCRACRGRITREAWLVVRAGNAEHRFRNPLGESFRLRCFGKAPGAAAVGPPSDHFTWFPGYEWRLASCVACQVQLGWHYSRDEATFWALITNQLTAPE